MEECGKNGSNQMSNPVPNPPTISAISPTSGPYSTLITLTGTGFNSSITGDSVKFNGVNAVIQQASPTQLQVLVPKGAGTGPVTVKVGNQTATGTVFTYTFTITVSTFAGSNGIGLVDGPALSASFSLPYGLTSDAKGNIYVSDTHNIRVISTSVIVSNLAGNGISGYVDGTNTGAEFYFPSGLSTDPKGNILVADQYGVRKLTTSGVVTTLAGIPYVFNAGPATPTNPINLGFFDGPALTQAEFYSPASAVSDAQGNIYVADTYNLRIRKISMDGNVTTIAGNGSPGHIDGSGNTSEFGMPTGIAIDGLGNLFVADETNNCIRKISPSGQVTTYAGTGVSGLKDGPANSAQFYNPFALMLDAQSNIYVVDRGNACIRMIANNGMVSTLAGNGTQGYIDGPGNMAEFYAINSIAEDPNGNFYVADSFNHRIRKITLQ